MTGDIKSALLLSALGIVPALIIVSAVAIWGKNLF
jgi:hypothetical protein